MKCFRIDKRKISWSQFQKLPFNLINHFSSIDDTNAEGFMHVRFVVPSAIC